MNRIPQRYRSPSLDAVGKIFKSRSKPFAVTTSDGESLVLKTPYKSATGALAFEWVCTGLADLSGSRVFQREILTLPKNPNLPEDYEKFVGTPVFGTTFESLHTFDGTTEFCRTLANKPDMARMMMLDTWFLNVDRTGKQPHSPTQTTSSGHAWGADRGRNWQNLKAVVSNEKPLEREIVTFDFGNCFANCGEFGASMLSSGVVETKGIFGQVSEFMTVLSAEDVIQAWSGIENLSEDSIGSLIREVPTDWMDTRTCALFQEFLQARLNFLKTRGVQPFLRQLPILQFSPEEE